MSDIFWARRTEDAGGVIPYMSELPAVDRWRLLRLTQELTDRWYPRIGLVAQPEPTEPTGSDLDAFALVSVDCWQDPRAFGVLSDRIELRPGRTDAPWAGLAHGMNLMYPEAVDWTAWVHRVEDTLGLGKLVGESGHEHCPHSQGWAALPLMWQVGIQLRTAGSDPADAARSLSIMTFADVLDHVPELKNVPEEEEQEGRWVALRTGQGWCMLSPTGWAYPSGNFLDLGLLHRTGAGAGELAAAVEDRLAREDLTDKAQRWKRLARLCTRANQPIARMMPPVELPDEIMTFASDDELVVAVDLDASQSTADKSLAYGLGLAGNRDLTVLLPLGQHTTTLRRAAFLDVGVRVWVHDGNRVAPMPVPAREEVLTALRGQAWSPARPGNVWGVLLPEEEMLAAAFGQTDPNLPPPTFELISRLADEEIEAVPLARHGSVVKAVYPIRARNPASIMDCLDRMMWVSAISDELSAGPVCHQLFADMVDGKPVLQPLHPAQIEAIDIDAVSLAGARLDDAGKPCRAPVGIRPEVFAPTTPPRPEPPRTSRSRWRQVAVHAVQTGGLPFRWPDFRQACLPQAWEAYLATKKRGGLATDIDDTKCAQLFAMNLFAPVGAAGAARVCKMLAVPVHRAEEPVFGYLDDDHGFDPIRVDVLLTGTTADGQRSAALIMVKLTEEEFSACPGYLDPANVRRDTCHTNAPFGGNPDACHLLRRRGGEQPLPYPSLITAMPGPSMERTGWWTPDGGCPIRRLGEPVRLLALAETLRSRRRYQHVAVALCAPAFEKSIQHRMAEATAMFRSAGGISLSFLPVEVILSATGHPNADELRKRYGIGNAERVAAPR
ncbi:hypothetical protein KZ829_36700 [Actinoplanes hulinensis]|uniref:Uncharacterized protein n=1 Tax=Actinoplanes hulinensis TaxID=1144547 RepID=A0ABS7BEI3_9ACTN|nr:hypothetical protein [Actinoplanes hulinensis]MBW6439278.1 hypothetical protein [Actinoplanes hulinensis]